MLILRVLQWLMLLTFSAAVVADVYVAVSLVYFLLRSRVKPTGFSSDLFKRYVFISI
jgi:hypothetical protein